ncbi:type II secretion system minor pseudopilin [Desulfonatronum parangueonense]
MLLAVLWVTALLSMFALNYSTEARLKGLSVQVSRDLSQDRLLLLSALELGRHEYLKYLANKSLLQDRDFMEWITGRPLELLHPRHEPYRVHVDGHPALVTIISEAGRLNVNTIPQSLLERILEACGVEPGQRMTMVVNSLLDWRDPDDLHRPEGAESDFYLGLDRPYYPKNNDLQSLEELLLVRGVEPELYHGTNDHPGLIDFLSVTGHHTILDVNSVSPRAFSLIEGFPEEIVHALVAFRESSPIMSMADLADVVPQTFMSQFVEYFGVVESSRATIRAALLDENERSGRWVERIVSGSG